MIETIAADRALAAIPRGGVVAPSGVPPDLNRKEPKVAPPVIRPVLLILQPGQDSLYVSYKKLRAEVSAWGHRTYEELRVIRNLSPTPKNTLQPTYPLPWSIFHRQERLFLASLIIWCTAVIQGLIKPDSK